MPLNKAANGVGTPRIKAGPDIIPPCAGKDRPDPFVKQRYSLYFYMLLVGLLFFFKPSQAFSDLLLKTDSVVDIYIQAVNEITRRSKENLVPEAIVKGSLKAYLKDLDPYSDYLTPEEYAAFKEAQKSRYSGIGMVIHQKKSGEVVCIPYPESNAENAGVEKGDVLLEVDGQPIHQRSLYYLSSRIRGEEGTSVLLTVKGHEGKQRSLKVVRGDVRTKTIVFKRHQQIPCLQIISFTPDTVRQMSYLIQGLDGDMSLILDLRGNPGGDLHAALDAAMLFLEKDRHLLTIHYRETEKTYQSSTPPLSRKSSLYIWQDGDTASAAEVFIAALLHNQRAASIGQTTFGKGTTQDVIELSDGSALILTTGHLEIGTHVFYDLKGIRPTYPIASENPDLSQYISKTSDLIKGRGGKAVVSVGSKKTPEPEKPVPASPAPTPSKSPEREYWLQVASFRAQDKAIRFIEKHDRQAFSFSVEITGDIHAIDHQIIEDLRSRNIPFFVNGTEKDRLFRVLVGSYPSQQIDERTQETFNNINPRIWRYLEE